MVFYRSFKLVASFLATLFPSYKATYFYALLQKLPSFLAKFIPLFAGSKTSALKFGE